MKLLAFISALLLSNVALAGEVVDQVFTFGGFQYRATVMDSFPYPFVTVSSDKLLLITHNSEYWDRKHITWPATARLVSYFRQEKSPLFYMADMQDRVHMNKANFFAAPIDKSEIYPFQGDSHRIVMQGQHVVIAGGNFTICACQTTRSVVALSQTKNLNVHLAMDAIYEGVAGHVFTLKEISDKLQDQEFMAYLKEQYFNSDSLPCAESFLSTNRSFEFRVYRQGRFLGKATQGRTVVNLYFDTSESITSKF